MRRRGIAQMWKAEKHADRLLAVSIISRYFLLSRSLSGHLYAVCNQDVIVNGIYYDVPTIFVSFGVHCSIRTCTHKCLMAIFYI